MTWSSLKFQSDEIPVVGPNFCNELFELRIFVSSPMASATYFCAVFSLFGHVFDGIEIIIICPFQIVPSPHQWSIQKKGDSWKIFLFDKKREENMSKKLLNVLKPRKGNREKMKETAQIWAMQELSLLYTCVSLSRNVCVRACAWKPAGTVCVGSGSWSTVAESAPLSLSLSQLYNIFAKIIRC